MVENIKDLFIEEEMKDSYLNYAMSVIMSRALPDVRDGLKPSQRRILVAMNDLGLGPRSKFRKCAKIAGDTTGNYHPHGEQVVYPTLVRMAQDFNYRYPLIQGQGNFGSIDGDPPAAMRYTEARMTEVTMIIMEDLERETVDYVPNYDDTRQEPIVLPSKFPNLLCNGCSGIAVGMATSIPPHNVHEICDGIIKIIDNPDVTIDELMHIIKGPDFPTGALICGTEGIKEGYRTGRGTITVRARVHTETTKSGKKSLVVTEIPYQLNRDNILERIADLVKEDQLKGISDIRNESDREGSRLVIDLKKGEDEEVVLNQLYKHTKLQDSFSIIMIALVNNRPETLNLKQMLVYYIEHRKVVIIRRTQYLLAKAQARAHILEGLRIALQNIDKVIQLIKTSSSVDHARQELISQFSLSEVQANAILDMKLQRLTGLEQEKIEEEYKKLCADIKEYEAILANEKLVLAIIKKDIEEVKERFGDKRRTEIVNAITELNLEDLIAEENVAVIITHEGYIKRLPLTSYRKQHRGGKGVTGAEMKEGDFIEHLFVASTHDYILFFTDQGRVYWQKVYDIPQMGRTSKGRALINLLELKEDENVTSLIPVRDFDERQLVMATSNGIIKKTPLCAYGNPKKGGIIAITLDEGDKLICVKLTNGKQDIILGTEQGKAVRFSETDVRTMGRVTHGVKGITLKDSDKVRGMVIVDENASLLTVCEHGFGKRTDFGEYSAHHRGGQGVINIKTTDRNGKVVALLDVRDEDELIMITAKGMVIRTSVNTVRAIGRNTQGVKLFSVVEGDKLVSVARVVPEEATSEGGIEEPLAGEITNKEMTEESSQEETEE
ncbi:MAG: DNA gyrase subunit A [Candidatus Jettenia sp.]|uniref:DNA gyrase subunit A n=1 Tax=Candidatus Jettenia caeni TaxID=247490 RepID=I3IHN2_9BACT|nr:DNA gyrase subunit A [Candidatus Jettenia sp. AMX1]MBC6928505.1 DNA gyrase subunit A [Candidatus Jettenia sp.]WKZ16555.1 MAG: DNA gyrase subunit A [Candidatus Jettenia caeni]KAA0251647.1 MAG: DNA gyrase subunit A [Candidatus Jettenia sp. AMX1]MCE7879819.1 DNA gyrase subunit A [Candidatus Jettenia sp. AMX1]MCQ3925901.1 DNA gyrase subunit A [Candidatus Jettenia sp.]